MSLGDNESIMAWVNNNTTSGYYDLYIGSNDPIKGVSLAYYFSNMTNVDSISFDNLDTSLTTNMGHMFRETGYNSEVFTLDLGENFDTSNVTNMEAMINRLGYSSTVFTLDLGDKFNTSKVTNMYGMFEETGYSSPVFTLNLGDNFDTSNVENINHMFAYTGAANSSIALDLSMFNFDKVTNYTDMFLGFKTTGKIYVKNTSDQTWITSKGFTNVTSSNVLVKS